MSNQVSREERLAQQLRANIRRRKVQARALSAGAKDAEAPPLSNAPQDS